MTESSKANLPNQLFQVLAVQLAKIRVPAEERIALDPLPDIQALIGISRQQIFSELGHPDNCTPEAQCMGITSWTYAFVHLPKGWRGGGPELNLSFDQQDSVQTAHWKFSR